MKIAQIADPKIARAISSNGLEWGAKKSKGEYSRKAHLFDRAGKVIDGAGFMIDRAECEFIDLHVCPRCYEQVRRMAKGLVIGDKHHGKD